MSSRQDLLKLSLGIPVVTTTQGTFSVNMEGQGRVIPQDPWLYPPGDHFATIDQGSVRMGVQWQDQRKDELKASWSSRYDFSQAKSIRG